MSRGAVRPAAALAAAACVAMPSAAQEFGVYLNCKGQVESAGRGLPSHVDLALRRNSQLALVQASDVLPAGQKLRLQATPQFYTMVFDVPARSSAVYYDWIRGALIVWNPDLKKVHTIRMSVDRQSAALGGEMLDGAGSVLARLKMRCEARDGETVATPKF